MNDEDPKDVVRKLSPPGGTPMPMTSKQFAELQAAFVQIATGTQQLIGAVQEGMRASAIDNQRTRTDNAFTRTVIVWAHFSGAIVAIIVLAMFVHRNEAVIRAVSEMRHESALQRGVIDSAVTEVRRAVSHSDRDGGVPPP